MILFALGDPAPSLGPGFSGLLTAMVVLAIMAGGAWLLRRGSLRIGALRRQRVSDITVETAFSLGERRSLAVVTVEGRRLVLGLTPAQISLITELTVAPDFASALARRQAEPETK